MLLAHCIQSHEPGAFIQFSQPIFYSHQIQIENEKIFLSIFFREIKNKMVGIKTTMFFEIHI